MYQTNITLKSEIVPIFCRPYTLPYALGEALEKELDEMVDMVSTNPLASANGQVQFCDCTQEK